MANKENQSQNYRIYIKESKNWVDVNKEFYTDYYRDINAYRKRQQEHGPSSDASRTESINSAIRPTATIGMARTWSSIQNSPSS